MLAQVRAGEVGVEGAKSLRGDGVQRHRAQCIDAVERNHGSILGIPREHVQVQEPKLHTQPPPSDRRPIKRSSINRWLIVKSSVVIRCDRADDSDDGDDLTLHYYRGQ